MTLPEDAMSRDAAIQCVRTRDKPWDLLIIGGGATGVGIAMDAASRGLECLLVEQSDFGKGTSSRSTKLVHGGVRYLRQGNITLVRDALRERSLLLNNAPHLVHDLSFLIPCASRWERFSYGIGLWLYDFLATGNRFGRSSRLNAKAAQALAPAVQSQRLRGGIIYHDGQFDDARLLINMARTAIDHGACLVNYLSVRQLNKDERGHICGAVLRDQETQTELAIEARCVVNATGPFCDFVRRLDDPKCEPMVATSQGVHLVLPRRFFPGNLALMVPKTADGRVLFVIPWQDRVLVGTTDTPIESATLEPTAQGAEVQFLLETVGLYLVDRPSRADVCSVFTGIRPLVRGDKSARTASLARDHVVRRSQSGLLTITGGKWTTVRKMSEDCVDRVVQLLGSKVTDCQTQTLAIHGAVAKSTLPNLTEDARSYYGSDLEIIHQWEREQPELATRLHPALKIRGSDVVWAVKMEMARTVEDVLARRTRTLFLDSRAAVAVAATTAAMMSTLQGRDARWVQQQVTDFEDIARHYRLE